MSSANSPTSSADKFRWLKEPGDHKVDVPIMCSITRFGLRNTQSMLPSYLDYRRVNQVARDSPARGLLRSAFLIENPTTWYSFSIWLGEPAFSAQVPAHIDAARRIFSRLSFEPDRGPDQSYGHPMGADELAQMLAAGAVAEKS